ncbi:glycosyltransferase family 87 protein [Singulisphaera sp. PoT]|uniref:glycosyltransferase family 87 protein n=1 Tax=Singulisphaera sp. PoT TaxID=3411797 RepID=UPI003BF4D3A4
MPPAADAAVPDFDRHFRRAIWIAALITAVGAALVYADKAAEDRSAFIRWRHQVLSFWEGVNIYDEMMFPNPPIFPITLYPFASLPKLTGAITWFTLKVALTTISIWLCFRMVRPAGSRTLPSWIQGPVILLTLRPIMGDLHHANNNLIILFLIVASLYSWRKGYDILAGLILALAISYKVTPALFVPYFAYKRSWRTVGATCVGMVLFLFVVPSMIIGPSFNLECLATWWKRMMSPFIIKGNSSSQEINQSLPGVLTRLLTETKVGGGRYDNHLDLNIVAWDPATVKMLVKGTTLAFVGLLALLCRTKTTRRDDPRLLGEFALVVLTMLFVSERSWKHHYVTLLLPYTYLVYRAASPKSPRYVRYGLIGALVASALFMASTSTEMGGLFIRGVGHKIAQGYGMFLWAGMILYIATAWRVWVEKNDTADDNGDERPVTLGRSSPAPHWAGRTRRLVSE